MNLINTYAALPFQLRLVVEIAVCIIVASVLGWWFVIGFLAAILVLACLVATRQHRIVYEARLAQTIAFCIDTCTDLPARNVDAIARQQESP